MGEAGAEDRLVNVRPDKKGEQARKHVARRHVARPASMDSGLGLCVPRFVQKNWTANRYQAPLSGALFFLCHVISTGEWLRICI